MTAANISWDWDKKWLEGQGKIDDIHGELRGFKVSAGYFPFLKVSAGYFPFLKGKIDGIHGELRDFKVSTGYFPLLMASLMAFMENSVVSR